jgi:phage terminase large subunit-like protein
MEGQIKAVEATPSKLTAFLTKQLNIWTNASERWLDPDEWRAGNEALLATRLLGLPCHGALDLGKVSDLSAFALVFRPNDVFKATGGKIRKHALLVWNWCPAEDIVKRSRDDRVPYDAWERAGFIKRMPGNTTDYAQIRADVEKIASQYQVADIAFDRMFAGETVQGLQRSGLTMVEFGQGFLSMGGPTAEFERLVKAGNLIHEPSPLLSWQSGNVVCEKDAADNIKPSKKKSREKIDGIVAGIMALGRVMVAKEEPRAPSVWVA